MRELLLAIKNICAKYKSQIILSIALLASIFFLVKGCEKQVSNKKIYDNNIKSLTEEVQLWKTKNGDLVAEKTLLEGDVKLLKQTNEDLYKQVEKLKVKPTQIVYLTNEIVNEVHDTTYVIPEITNYLRQDFDFSNNWRTLTGFIEYNKPNLSLTFDKDIVQFDYTIALKDNKVYVTSNNPYIQYNDIQGITIPKTEPRWSIAVGPSFGLGYGLINKNLDFYIGGSITLGYNLKSFGNKK